jgi:hypothetical protein
MNYAVVMGAVSHKALHATSIRSRSRDFILKSLCNRRTIVSRIPAMTLGFVQKTEDGKLPSTAVAAIADTVVPANAAHVVAGCSGPNLTKTESMIENMTDGDGKIVAQREVKMAQDSRLSGKIGACFMHLGKAMHAGMAK